MPGDWIKLHRKLLDSPIMRHSGLLHLWTYCLLRANWRDCKWLIPGTLRELHIRRGQFVTGQQSLHAQLYPPTDENGNPIARDHTPTARTVWRWLIALKVMGCLTLESVSNRCTLVTLCNYRTYQDDEGCGCLAGVQPVSSRCLTGVLPMSTIEEGKEGEEGKKRARVRGFVKPTVAEVAAYCREQNIRIDPQLWWDSYESKGWRIGKELMSDWRAAVRTWEKRQGEFSRNGHEAPPEPSEPSAQRTTRQRREAEQSASQAASPEEWERLREKRR